MKRFWVHVTAAALTAGAAVASHATDAETLRTRTLAATCANCHGTDGRNVPGSPVAVLAGQNKDYIVEQMKAFRDGKRPATVMHQLAKGYTDAQIDKIAAYFAAQKN